MLTLTGKIRQLGKVEMKDGSKLTKLWIEHESPGWNEGEMDIKIDEFMFPESDIPENVKAGQEVTVSVRVYARAGAIVVKAIKLISSSFKGVAPVKPAPSR